MRHPLVTVVTPTRDRHDLLARHCIPSVAAQTYRGPIEHIIVSGPDPRLRSLCEALAPAMTARGPGRTIRYHEIDPDVADGGATPRRVGIERAHGEIVAYLDDDCAYRPGHVQKLVASLLFAGADFAFSQMQQWHGDAPGNVIGDPPPRWCHIDTSIIVHRAELLHKATWEKVPGGAGGRIPDPDGDLVTRWVEAGAAWSHVPEVTVDYWVGEPGGSR